VSEWLSLRESRKKGAGMGMVGRHSVDAVAVMWQTGGRMVDGGQIW